MDSTQLLVTLTSIFQSKRLVSVESYSSPYFWFSTPQAPKKNVHVERRRRGEPPASGRERAETPQRRDHDQAPSGPSFGGLPPSGGGGGQGPFTGGGISGGGGGSPLGGKSMMMILVLALIFFCIFGSTQLFGGGAGSLLPSIEQPSNQQPEFGVQPTEPYEILPVEAPTQQPKPTATRQTIQVPPGSAANTRNTWLVMLYQDADDKVLEQDIYLDLNEAEKVGSSENVKIVAQIDRYRSGFQGDGDWVSAKRFYVEQDDDLSRVRSQEIADLGEVNMADGATLVDFVTWAIKNYPADRYALILSDHGMGWPGGWSDDTSTGTTGSRAPLSMRIGDFIFLNELGDSLAEVIARTGIDKLDLIGLDACLMSQIEVYSELEPYARVAVASEEVEPALGWAYAGFLSSLVQNPSMDAVELSRLIVDSYISEDQRIVDDQARSEMLRQGSGMNGLFGMFGQVTPQMLARQMSQDSTLAAIDLSTIPAFIDELNNFSYALQSASQPEVAKARAYARSYTSIFGSSVPPSYIDLGNFLQLLQQITKDKSVSQAADSLLQAISNAVIAEKHGPKKDGSTGIAIYFPNTDLYRTAEAGARSYTAIADRFSSVSLWDDFLAFHYTGRFFEPQTRTAVIPETGAAVRGPGVGRISLSPVKASRSSVSPGETITLETDVSGANIGYAYLFVGYYDQAGSSIFVADMDYLESSDTRQVNGVYYPDWGSDQDFTLEFDWEPIVFAIDDGQQRVTALFKPMSYGATWEEATYAVDGIYTFADSGDTLKARLLFTNGVLRQVIGFTGDPQTSAPYEIIPNRGDQFTLTERWLDLDQSGQVREVAEQQGRTLTFDRETFRWVELDAAAGQYVVGFLISDLDGNTTETYTRIDVR